MQPLWKTVWRFLKKVKIALPYDPAIPLLGIYPDKIIIKKDMCTLMFITALFTIAKTWKQSKCSSTDEWIKKISFIFSGYPIWASLVAQRLKCLPAIQETWVRSLGREGLLEKETATHSSILAWRIPRMEEPGGLRSTGSQRVGHD